ncbi:hypothetical protein D6D17_10522 [Aureobasidium pullulans]|uniref:Uncharacterized protein n=1 Tax=Aureobasidium pullulans TaxID=5580 RepID=A0A4S8XZH8_AURPU|nr:hypothetical protein D6D22_04077 [Aureobasidium pullulans]THW75684.1 hypothetical protein D6D17_10522 [Aureobasidium pullulans]THZ12461.1 hypothetical protein D6C91_08481 [Aureobasidium pullulans]TIA27772.1 hypothetical protein D6C79_10513 [Aureobasidium pullulans]TIA57840.1 hypothetical protein D6C76_10720 [Aureobasidium pullulans]
MTYHQAPNMTYHPAPTVTYHQAPNAPTVTYHLTPNTTYHQASTTVDVPSTPPTPPVDQAKAKENAIMLAAAYALCTILLACLDIGGLSPTADLDIAARWIGSLLLLIACLVLLVFCLEALGSVFQSDDHCTGDSGRQRAHIGAIIGVYANILLAALSGCLDNKGFIYQIFWCQTLALPAAFIVSKYLGGKMDHKEEMLLKFCAYGLVNMMLWLDLQNLPLPLNHDSSELSPFFAWMGWIAGFVLLLATSACLLFANVDYIVKVRLADNPSGRILTILGAMIGVGIMVLGVMAPFEMLFHVLEGKHWMYQILWAESGALPGAYLIGGSAWFANMYGCQQSILPQYSTVNTVNTTEAQAQT